MDKRDISYFIEEMEPIGDHWTAEEVERVYGNTSLEAALSDRKSALNKFFGILGTVIGQEDD